MFIDSVSDVVMLALSAVSGIAASFAICLLLNTVPAKWFCDYDEQPTEEMLGVRFAYKKTVPVLSAVLFVCYAASFLVYRCTVYCIIFDAAVTLLAGICISDIKFTVMPDQLTAALAVIAASGAAYDILNDGIFCGKWYISLIGGLCGAGIIFLINLFSLLVFKKVGIGLGDLKLFAALGLLAGIPGIFILIYLSLITAFFHFLPLLLAKKFKKDQYYPMGPYICIASTVFFIFGKYINNFISWYIGGLF